MGCLLVPGVPGDQWGRVDCWPSLCCPGNIRLYAAIAVKSEGTS
jgi:hypothetical protein